MLLQCYLVVQFIIYTSHTLVLYHNNFILNDTSFIFISGIIRNGESRETDKHPPAKLDTSNRFFIWKSHTVLLVGDREGTDWQEAKSPRSCNNQRRKRGGRGACIRGRPIDEKRCIKGRPRRKMH